MNSLSLVPSQASGQTTQALIPASMVSSRLKLAQDASLQTVERVRQALEKQFSGLVEENTSLRKELSSSTLQNRELILVQRQEISYLQEQLTSSQSKLAHVLEQNEAERASFHQQIQALREELRKKEEEGLSKEQEAAQTVASLRGELTKARQDTLQRIKALQTEKEAAIQEVRASVMQQVAQARLEERSLANQEAERRMAALEVRKKLEMDQAVEKAYMEGALAFYVPMRRNHVSLLGPLAPWHDVQIKCENYLKKR